MRYLNGMLAALVIMSFSVAYGDESHEHPAKEKRFVATVGADGVQHVDIVGGSYFFDPNYIVVKVNVPVEFKVRKDEKYVPHDIVAESPEAGIVFKTDLSSSEPSVVKFTPTKTGTYPMYCDKRLWPFKSHRERGMDGMIEVIQ